MQHEAFQAFVVDSTPGGPSAAYRELTLADLPEGDVLVKIQYSSLNYKDGLAVTGQEKIIRSYPMVPGIDWAGTVVSSSSPRFQPGDEVVMTGWGAGERFWGGYAQYARTRAEWLLPLPRGLSALQAMGIGTAGLTAMLCVLALEKQGLAADRREVIVTGASGGVGSVAVLLLSLLGHQVTASTGRPEASADFLRSLGARHILPREELARPGKPLESERWGAAVDTVGGDTLASLLSRMAYGSSIAACGLVGGSSLQTTVYPLILRGVNLLGIDSVMAPLELREAAWSRLAELLPKERLESLMTVLPFRELPQAAEDIVQGRTTGRIVIDVNR
ncbi:MDR family oxidoreductase [Paenibacillus silviterrae]|uniref:MDR family oxidoreductase n=1 Tax=Paenibacillus silviterrae TaxID=3242194 RepID=UPI002543D68A|nr:MDR family oxidoreductase [Paenibacillus chinjuensis]